MRSVTNDVSVGFGLSAPDLDEVFIPLIKCATEPHFGRQPVSHADEDKTVGR